MGDITGSIAPLPTKPASNSPEDLKKFSDALRERYEKHPENKAIGLAYAHSLRARDLNQQAAAVLQELAIKHSRDREVLAAYGKALADAGQLQQAQAVLEQADSPDDPNWSVVSTRGLHRRSARRPRRRSGLLRKRPETVAGRAFRAVQSRPVLRSFP